MKREEKRPENGSAASQGANDASDAGPTWGGLIFNLNLLINAGYLIGTLVLFVTLFGPLLAAWASNKQLVEWSPKEKSD